MNKQTNIKNKELIEFARKNATQLIKRLIELTEYQENIKTSYSIKKIKDC